MFDVALHSWVADVMANLVVSLVTFAVGFLIGKQRERTRLRGRNLEQYDFYPFVVDEAGFPAFDVATFCRGVRYLLERDDATAATQLIVIGEQNGMRYHLEGESLQDYEKLYARYHGQEVMQDSSEFLENYRRIVRGLGRTFREMGIEVLLHDLMNPTRSITTIVGGEVTGRSEGMGSTNLVIDLKRRFLLNQDKVNYELDIGARRFKCTTVPIVREPYGVVAAICINIDTNYIRDRVLADATQTQEFFRRYTAVEMQLDENILSRAEYELAMAGKRHWQDTVAAATT